MDAIWLIIAALMAFAAAGLVARQAVAAGRSARRLEAIRPGGGTASPAGRDQPAGWLATWLSRAGYRGPRAAPSFLAACAAAALAGLGSALFLWGSSLVREVIDGLERIPGGFGQAFVPLVLVAPALIVLPIAAVPWLHVRRRRLVEAVEQDLPISLELFATLAEAGYGFDSALAQVLASETVRDRPLEREFRQFQLEIRSGRPRVECFHRLRERLDAPAMNILVSALVTAEQLGASTSEVLRIQSIDLRGRRRERAMAIAQGLPVKLIFPLMFCFLPGIFVVTLGPAFYQLFQLADTVIRGAR